MNEEKIKINLIEEATLSPTTNCISLIKSIKNVPTRT